MTAGQAIQQTDGLLPNAIEAADKLRWLETLDGLLGEETGLTIPNAPYDADTQLPVDRPHGACYIHWLQAKILYTQGEFTRYQNAMNQFNAAYLGLTGALIRESAPKQATAWRY